MRDWKDNHYLSLGTPSQVNAWNLLCKTKILSQLADYNPVVIGTLPIDVDIEGSDLDIACEVYEPKGFMRTLKKYYPQIVIIKRKSIVIGRMLIEGTAIEIYGENCPVDQQNGYIHMLVEALLLEKGGDALRQKVRKCKLSGLKTEPAFCACLGIAGNPYAALADLAHLDSEEIDDKIFGFGSLSG